MIEIRQYEPQDVPAMRRIWNEVIETGNAFPQVKPLGDVESIAFFAEQTYSAVAEGEGEILGLYILHPNDIGRKSHIANASYAVRVDARGRGVGHLLVTDSLAHVAPCGFRGMQFNAVVASNKAAIKVYEDLGMTRIGTIPGGFKSESRGYEDMFIYYWDAR